MSYIRLQKIRVLCARVIVGIDEILFTRLHLPWKISNPLSTTVSGLLGLNALELDMKYRSRFSNDSFDSPPSDSMSTVVLTKNSSLLGLEFIKY